MKSQPVKYASRAEVDAFHQRKAAARVADWTAIRRGQIKDSMLKSSDLKKARILSYPFLQDGWPPADRRFRIKDRMMSHGRQKEMPL